MDSKTAPTNVSNETLDGHHPAGKRHGFWTKKKMICAAILAFIIVALVIILPVLFLVIGPKLAQSGINDSVLTVTDASILDPQNASFNMALAIAVTNAGKVKATLTHTSPVAVWWVVPGKGQQQLLTMTLPPFSVDHSGDGTINANVQNVTILDQTLFAQFNQFLIASPTFQWRLVGELSAHALGRDFDGLTMDKTITVTGMNKLADTNIPEFKLLGFPSATDATPILMNATLVNPSPVGLSLGVIVFNVTDITGTVVIGNATTTGDTIVLGGGQTTKMLLTGFIMPLGTFPPALTANLTQVLGGAMNLTLLVTPESVGGANPISWVQGGLKGLPLMANMGKAPSK